MRGWLFSVLLATVVTACTNDYGQFRFPPDSAGGASNGDASTGGTFAPLATGGSAGAN
jgi:hypothetical protein